MATSGSATFIPEVSPNAYRSAAAPKGSHRAAGPPPPAHQFGQHPNSVAWQRAVFQHGSGRSDRPPTTSSPRTSTRTVDGPESSRQSRRPACGQWIRRGHNLRVKCRTSSATPSSTAEPANWTQSGRTDSHPTPLSTARLTRQRPPLPVANTQPGSTPGYLLTETRIVPAREGGHCRHCPLTGIFVVVHTMPGSTFLAGDLRIADRSDNLASACWGCNENKSNFEHEQTKLLGVTAVCFYCTYPEHSREGTA